MAAGISGTGVRRALPASGRRQSAGVHRGVWPAGTAGAEVVEPPANSLLLGAKIALRHNYPDWRRSSPSFECWLNSSLEKCFLDPRNWRECGGLVSEGDRPRRSSYVEEI